MLFPREPSWSSTLTGILECFSICFFFPFFFWRCASDGEQDTTPLPPPPLLASGRFIFLHPSYYCRRRRSFSSTTRLQRQLRCRCRRRFSIRSYDLHLSFFLPSLHPVADFVSIVLSCRTSEKRVGRSSTSSSQSKGSLYLHPIDSCTSTPQLTMPSFSLFFSFFFLLLLLFFDIPIVRCQLDDVTRHHHYDARRFFLAFCSVCRCVLIDRSGRTVLLTTKEVLLAVQL